MPKLKSKIIPSEGLFDSVRLAAQKIEMQRLRPLRVLDKNDPRTFNEIYHQHFLGEPQKTLPCMFHPGDNSMWFPCGDMVGVMSLEFAVSLADACLTHRFYPLTCECPINHVCEIINEKPLIKALKDAEENLHARGD
jgi:hypothetical protein